MSISRRSLLKVGAALPALSLPGIVRAESQSTLRFIPVIDLAFVDPIYSTAQVSRNHGFMVYDTLYGMSSSLQVSPQMLSGHAISADQLQWDLTLRDGLFWHDGERVLARDCVASIRRWAARDGFGGELMEATAELSAADDRTIRFRLKRPFPLLPQALGKAAINACFMMPERLASQDPFKPLTEVIGSGPFRYLADERVQGARNAYAKFERYQPRTDGKPDWTAGPKIVHYDRVVWTTTPDAGTGVAALQTGEQDWQETTPHDLLPVIKAAGDIETRILDPRGYACMLRLNHLQPPFDNPAIRRALLGAIDQSAFMTAVAGTDPAFQVSPVGYFAPGTPMANEVGLDVFRGPRDYAKVKADLKAAGYNGEKIVLLVPTNSLAQKPLGEIAVDSLRKAGMNVEYAGLDFAVVLQRHLKKDPLPQGGWSAAVGNWQGIDWLNPAGNTNIRGEGKVAGWYASEKMGPLRSQWLAASELAEQQRICREVQRVAFEEIPYIPIGLYKQPTAYRKAITGILDGTAVFWNVRPA
ncbi:ABC transporter substrate-binding protein [Bradyrhizobium yuanmingense]|uniref:ABC transporter substrate-binding protein n=1 Tax=Bradyrhizobium yuanmingense TaxID=108015 RepID=A0A0R3CCB0_9BRAD|nr:ABC transporter substrate-binding protein [Bradyrhizobium yuanmingense]KRP94012.1 ABC transporter substrate-binding protein [Bradyrhizobium yuanmingense]